jgi:hypothetical protein
MRAEYEGLRVMSLHARATSEGIEAEKLDACMEGKQPKAALIEMLLAKRAADAQQAALDRLPQAPTDRASSSSSAAADELRALRVMALHAHAVSEGVDETAIEDAMDSGNPKDDLVALILGARRANAAKRKEQLRSELESMRVMELHARATALEGIDASLADDAMDSDNPKRRLVDLLLNASG